MRPLLHIEQGDCNAKSKSRQLLFEDELFFDDEFDDSFSKLFEGFDFELFLKQTKDMKYPKLRHRSDNGKQSVGSNSTDSTIRGDSNSGDDAKTLRMKLDLTKELVNVLSECVQDFIGGKNLSPEAVLNCSPLVNAQRNLRGVQEEYFLKDMESKEVYELFKKLENVFDGQMDLKRKDKVDKLEDEK